MKKFIVFISLVSLLLSMVAVWYFGYFYPAQNKNTAPPIVVVEKQLSPTTPGVSPQKPPLREDAVGMSKKDSVLTPADRNTGTNTPENTDAVESSPNDIGTATPDEHTEREHNHSSEETSAEEADFEALMKELRLEEEETEALRESSQNVKDRAFPKLISHLNSQSPEEQSAFLMQAKDWFYNEYHTSSMGVYLNEISLTLPDVNIEEILKEAWNSVLTDLVKYGYTLPAGIKKE